MAAENQNDKARKDVALKNNAPFRLYISKINNTLVNNAEDLDIVMSMNNLLEYSDNCSVTSERLWNYLREKIGGVYDNVSHGKSFE